MPLQIKRSFDEETFRHSINGHEFVLHCHHYMTLTTKMAEDFAALGAVEVLRESTEDSIRPVLDSYYAEHGVTSPEERLAIGAEYYAFMGMGLMEVTGTAAAGQVKLKHSHVDEGWIKKWGKHSKAINHFTCGYIAALFAAAYSRPARSYNATEVASIVMGAPESILVVKAA